MRKVLAFLAILLTASVLAMSLIGCDNLGYSGDNPIFGNLVNGSKGSDDTQGNTEEKPEEKAPENEEKPEERAPEEEPEKDKKEDDKFVATYELWKGAKNHKIYVDKEDKDVFVLEKKADKDFVIVNFADTQADDSLTDFRKGTKLRDTIQDAIDTYSPDLITLSGDQCWGNSTWACYKFMASCLDSYKIPWAVAFGNHDGENAEKSSLGYIVRTSDYGIFAYGDESLPGMGNYSVNIVEEGTNNIVHSVIMIDSGMGATRAGYLSVDLGEGTELPSELSVYAGRYDQETGILNYTNYYADMDSEIVDWYEDRINDLTEKSGKVVESTCVFHIPLPEFVDAYVAWALADESGREAFEPEGDMRMLELVSTGVTNFGFFDKVLELGSTKNIIVGHDHINDYSLVYKGVRLTYSVKTGDQCYWVEDGSMCGCTALTIDSTGKATSEQHYFNPNAH